MFSKFLLFSAYFPSWATWQMYATSRQVDGAPFYQLGWILCDDGQLADDSDDVTQKYKQNYGTHTSSFGPCLWLWWQQYFFLHGKVPFCSKLIQMQIQLQILTNKKIITKAKRPPAVCVVLHIQVQLLDKCYNQQTSRQVFALRQFSILSRAIFRFRPGNILLNSKDDCFLFLQNNLLI